jgi:hypothetical protein
MLIRGFRRQDIFPVHFGLGSRDRQNVSIYANTRMYVYRCVDTGVWLVLRTGENCEKLRNLLYSLSIMLGEGGGVRRLG